MKKDSGLKKRIDFAPFRFWDACVFMALAGMCFLLFQQGDILHTGGSSFAYLNGHVLDFYEYNATVPDVQVNNYLPTTYILFALWNLPLKLLGVVTEVTQKVGLFACMWYKLLPTLFFLGSSVIIYHIAKKMGMGEAKSKLAVYLALTTPTAFFSQFIFGQYDAITVFFVLLGIWFWCSGRLAAFSLMFGVAITCKYFSLLLFLPMLFLREKSISKIIRCVVLAAIPFVAEVLVYLPSEAFRQGVFGFGATGYIFAASIQTYIPSVSIVVLAWAGLCAGAYLTEPENETQMFQWFVFLGTVLTFLIFGLSLWHPQWLMFAMPIFVFSLLLSKKYDAIVLLDCVLMTCFVIFIVNQWANHVDQQLFSGGILGDIVSKHLGYGLTMRQLFVIQDKNLVFSVFSAILLVFAIMRYPKFSSNNFEQISEMPANFLCWSRARFVIGVSIFVIPAVICLVSMLTVPCSLLGQTYARADHINPITADRQIEQYFVLPDDSILSEIVFEAGTYMRENQGTIAFSVCDADTEEEIVSAKMDLADVSDNIETTLEVEPVSLEAGRQYCLKVVVSPASQEDTVTIYRSEEGTAEPDLYAVVDGQKTDYTLCIDLLGDFS